MLPLVLTSILFGLLSLLDYESTDLVAVAIVLLLLLSGIYVYNQLIDPVRVKYLQLFCVCTNLIILAYFLLSIQMGAGNAWSFASLLTHPFNPLTITFRDLAAATSLSALSLLVLFVISSLKPIVRLNLQLSRTFDNALRILILNRSFHVRFLIISSTVLWFGLLGFYISGGLGTGQRENTLSGILIRSLWFINMPFLAVALFRHLSNSNIAKLTWDLLYFFFALAPVIVFAILNGRRQALVAVITTVFFTCRCIPVWNSFYRRPRLHRLRLTILIKSLLRSARRWQNYMRLTFLLIGLQAARVLIDSYQFLREAGGDVILVSIYSAIVDSFHFRQDTVELVINESQAARLLVLAPLANLVNIIRFENSLPHYPLLAEWVHPFLNAVPSPILNFFTPVAKDSLPFGEITLSSQLGYSIDFTDVLVTTFFSSFGLMGIAVGGLLTASIVYLYFLTSVYLLPSFRLGSSNPSFFYCTCNIYAFSVIASMSLGGFTDAGLSFFFRIGLTSLMSLFVIENLYKVFLSKF